MYGFHSAIIVAIIVTASLASNLLAIVTIGSAGAGTSALLRMRLGLRRSPRRVKRLVDSWVAGMLARREQQAATWASDRMHDRELRRASRRKPGRPQ